MKFLYRHGDRPIDGYTILRGVGRGGFGEVYYAVSDGGREVALKTILFNPEIELRGVRHCINLKSPHLVSVFDVRKAEDGTAFIVMEFVRGPSLRQILDKRPQGVNAAEAAYLAREIARGLEALHRNGIVHRDLKPENIFLEDGYVKIGDYGLAKAISPSRQTAQTISVGTVHYMAPEIGSGSYSRAIDIYAFGVILYELLTGKVPFNGDSFGEILLKHLSAEPDLSAIAEPFRSAVGRALRKSPGERFDSAVAMVDGIVEDGEISRSLASFDLSSIASGAATIEGAPIAPRSPPAPAPPPIESAAPVVAPASPPEAAVPPPPPPAPSCGPVFRLSPNQRAFVDGASAAIARALRWALRRFVGEGESHGAGPPPGVAARYFWVFVGSALVIASLATLVSIPIDLVGYGDVPIAICTSVGLFGLCGFAFYRGLYARRSGFWRRSLFPLIRTCLIAAALVAATVLILEYSYSSRPHQDVVFGSVVIFSIAVFLLVVCGLLRRLYARWEHQLRQTPPGVPDPQRPLPAVARVAYFLLAWPVLIVALQCLVYPMAYPTGGWERFAFLLAALLLGIFGAFLLRQSFRRARGTLWSGTIRPFLITAILCAYVACILRVLLAFSGEPAHGDEMAAFLVIGSAATAVGLAILILSRTRGASGKPS